MLSPSIAPTVTAATAAVMLLAAPYHNRSLSRCVQARLHARSVTRPTEKQPALPCSLTQPPAGSLTHPDTYRTACLHGWTHDHTLCLQRTCRRAGMLTNLSPFRYPPHLLTRPSSPTRLYNHPAAAMHVHLPTLLCPPVSPAVHSVCPLRHICIRACACLRPRLPPYPRAPFPTHRTIQLAPYPYTW